MNKKNIIVVAAIVVVVIAIALIGQKGSSPYVMSDQESLDYVAALNEAFVFPKGVNPLKQTTEGVVIVDLRDINQYSRQHLMGAVNVPVEDVLKPEIFDQMNDFSKDGRLVVFYGEDESSAAPVVYLLKQMGVSGARALVGGFSFWQAGGNADSLKTVGFTTEVPIGDYAKLMTIRGGSDSTQSATTVVSKPKKVAPKPVAKKAAAEGGC